MQTKNKIDNFNAQLIMHFSECAVSELWGKRCEIVKCCIHASIHYYMWIDIEIQNFPKCMNT